MAKEEPLGKEGTQAKTDRYMPWGEDTEEGARQKMRYLAEHTHIRVGIPLRQQIYWLLASEEAQETMGLTVQEVSKKLSLNTKTCAKVLDEVTARYEGVRATSHRYGRVFQYKYLVQQFPDADDSPCVEDDEYTKSLNPLLHAELKAMDSETQQRCRKAMMLSLKDKPQGSRTRVTHQNFVRALFIVHKLRKMRVASIFEMKVSIVSELEPKIKWSLDKKTVLRIVWKLQRVGLIRQMCFRVVLRKHADRVVDYLGDDYESIKEDKRRLSTQQTPSGSMILHRVLISLPEVFERDHEVLDNPLLSGKKSEAPKDSHYSTNVKSRILKSAISAGNERLKLLKLKGEGLPSDPKSLLELVIPKGEEPAKLGDEVKNGLSEEQHAALTKSYQLFVMATFVFDLYRKKVKSRYELLFNRLMTRPEVIALKKLLSVKGKMPHDDEICQYMQENPLKKQCLWTPQLQPVAEEASTVPIAASVPVPLKVGKKASYKEVYGVGKKLLLWLARHPGAKTMAGFEATAKIDRQLVCDIVDRMVDLQVLVKTEDGRVRLTKRGLPS